MSRGDDKLVTRVDLRVNSDPSRVLAKLFVPGLELRKDRQSGTSGLLYRILTLSEDVVGVTLDGVYERFSGRHRDLTKIFKEHFERVAHRLSNAKSISNERQMLIGACFTNEYSVEAAAIFNPSAVMHPDQRGLDPGQIRFVMSLRALGEGHISSLEFRSGVVGPDHKLKIDDPGRFLDAGQTYPTTHDRNLFEGKLVEEGADEESSSFLIGQLPTLFDNEDLETGIAALAQQGLSRRHGAKTESIARRILACSYEVDYSDVSLLQERILWPNSPSESHGIEDARFVRFTYDDGTVTYFATYTAFDGKQVTPQLIETTDFVRFRISLLLGPAARNKGMALFPRKVGGLFVALSRWDRESIAIATSVDGSTWGVPITLHRPEQPWELLQLGNAGSPIETDAGWLVITHAVGPMREYSLGAILLDLEDPTRVIASLRSPLLRAEPDERDGYVPNVVYSCGALCYGDQLLLPYGVSDSSVRFAFVDLPLLLARLADDGVSDTTRSNNAE